ncbi:MAG: B12-binding domain-containing radical SAM protein [Clostridia bacterium]|nr:B12-binding domain-containing radical SAM protein [Clostridia bacterium]
MNVLLIMPYHCDLIHAVSLPLGILSIASYLEKHGVNVKIHDFSVHKASPKNVYPDFKPDIVGLSFPSCKAIDGMVKISKYYRKTGVPIVWGGSFCDVADTQHFFDTGLVDIISYCEGEATWLDLVRTLERGGDLADVEGIAYLKNGEVTVTPPRAFMDPAELPQLDFSLVDVPDYYTYLYGCSKLVYVYLSKGCPAHCNFCVNTMCHRNTRRRRPLDVFMAEIEELAGTYGADGFYFGDELAFASDKELYEVSDAFKNTGLPFHWGFQTRIGILSDQAIQYAYDCGCRWIDFGVESGNREMLAKVAKGIPYDKIESTFRACSKAGLISIANFIIGFPGETEDQFRDSIELAQRLESTQNTFAKYIFVPSTPGGQEVVRTFSKYPVFRKLNDYKQMDFFRNRQKLSHIPQKDLDVVQAYFLMNAIFRKDYSDSRDYDLLFKSVITVVRRVSKMPFVCAVKALEEISSDFARFVICLTLHPGILRKYGLKPPKEKRKNKKDSPE